MLKEEFRRAFFSWGFVLALVITSVCFAIGLKEYGPPVSPFIRPEEQHLYPFTQNAFDAFLCAMGLMGPLVFFCTLDCRAPVCRILYHGPLFWLYHLHPFKDFVPQISHLQICCQSAGRRRQHIPSTTCRVWYHQYLLQARVASDTCQS